MFGFERRATYFCFVEGQTHCGTEMSLTLGQSIWKVPQSNLCATSKHAPNFFSSMEGVVCKATNSWQKSCRVGAWLQCGHPNVMGCGYGVCNMFSDMSYRRWECRKMSWQHPELQGDLAVTTTITGGWTSKSAVLVVRHRVWAPPTANLMTTVAPGFAGSC